MKGITDNVLIMPVIIGKNSTRDKDMIFGIRYAVDNGADIINISIAGSPSIGEHTREMMEAFDYANTHGVLVVNAAGNDAYNLDSLNYNLGDGLYTRDHGNFMRVGATTTLFGDSLVSNLSNVGQHTVDIFAPGTAIYSTIHGNKYDLKSGTSFACPVVVGVAALVKSYFPSLTSVQIKEILMESSFKPEILVLTPPGSGLPKEVLFSKLSKSGGIVNAYNAVRLADKMVETGN